MLTPLQKLLISRAKLVADMRALSNKAEAETRGLNTDEEKQFETWERECDALDGQIKREQKLVDREKEERHIDTDYDVEPAYGAAGERRSAAEYETEEDESDEKRTVQKGAGSGEKRSKWESFGTFLQQVRQAEVTGERPDKRLIRVRSASGINEAVPSEGGFLVEKEMIGGLMQRAFESGVLASKVKKLPIGPGKNGVSMLRLIDDSRATGSRYGGVRAYWLGEGQTKTPSKPAFDLFEMKLKKLAALCYVTDEMLEDAVFLEGLISDIFPAEMGFVIDDAILYGSGLGMPLGIFNSGAVITVSKESAQAASTINFQNVLNMVARFWETAGSNPMWFINRNIIPQLSQMSLSVGTGGVPVWMPANGAVGQRFSTLFGYPVVPIEHAATLGALGDIMLGDMSQYLMIEKGDIKKDVSIHVRFVNDETAFRFVKRLDGQPLPTSPITPYKGSGTLSPFVILEAR